LGLPVFGVFGHAGFLAQRAKRRGLDSAVETVSPETVSETLADALPVIAGDGEAADRPGQPDPNTAPVVVGAIAQAVAAVRAGTLRGVVTAPIHKAALYGAGFEYPGHTEFLAALCAEGSETPLPVMMLAHDDLRTVPLTIHIPLADVPGRITGALIEKTIRVIARDLATRFRIAAPRIGVAGLNPHAGEDGMIGS